MIHFYTGSSYSRLFPFGTHSDWSDSVGNNRFELRTLSVRHPGCPSWPLGDSPKQNKNHLIKINPHYVLLNNIIVVIHVLPYYMVNMPFNTIALSNFTFYVHKIFVHGIPWLNPSQNSQSNAHHEICSV